MSDYGSWSASVDGRWVAASRSDRTDNIDIWLNDHQRGAWSRFTFDAAADTGPVFSPDGARIVFGATRAGVAGLYVKPSSGVGSEQLLLGTFGEGDMSPQDWSSDGRLILFGTSSFKNGWDIGVVAASGGTPGKLVIHSQHGERGGQFSLDMKWIAYDSTESGRRDVWLQPFPPTGDR